ncbi:N-terminal kinase-like protein yata isoform X2 [Oratosquilla oratoria]|uniref:N-terminal kinase-like protein yata isoform X2 n=1 Tax=Oratosquilla oratoria TaxID=337810 RepID=UPI003F75A33A
MWIFTRDPASTFPYEILDPVEGIEEKSVWRLHKGKKKNGGGDVSVFVCEVRDGNTTHLDVARAAVKRLKTLRHPSILTFVDSLESEKLVYLVTESVSPLLTWLQDASLTPKHKVNAISWGLLQVMKGLSFLNNDCKLIHYNVSASSVFVTSGGEWKLGGVEYTSSESSFFPVKIVPQLDVYDPPEKHDPAKMRVTTKWSADMWGFGCLIWESFNGHLDKNTSLKMTAKLPKVLLPTYCELVHSNPNSRPNPKDVIEQLRRPGQFFHNDLIETLIFLEEIQIKDSNERQKFFTDLGTKLDNIPDYMSKNKILPAVLNAHEFSNVGSVVLTSLFKIGKLLDEADYQRQILPCVIKLFSSNDRATRLKLLQQMSSIGEHMSAQTVNDQVFAPLATGFLDTNPTIREHTVKSIMHLAPKLNYNNLNVEVMKYFARLQAKDEQGGIRTNTTVCLGKIASYLHPETRQKCLISAFTRAMRDPFPPARTAGIMALAGTQQYYPLSDAATRVLPALSQLTLDPEKSVRDAAFRVIKGFLSKLEKVSEDPSLKEEMEREVTSASSASAQTPSWTGWAVGALASKFYKSSISNQQSSAAPSGTPNPSAGSSSANSGSSSQCATPSTINSSLHSTPSQDHSKKELQEEDESDYEDEWSNTEWKAVDSSPEHQIQTASVPVESNTKKQDTVSPPSVSAVLSMGVEDSKAGDGWDEEDDNWGSLEDPVMSTSNLTSAKREEEQQPEPSGWDVDDTFEPMEDTKPSSAYQWSNTSDDFFSSVAGSETSLNSSGNRARTAAAAPSSTQGGWEDWTSAGSLTKGDEVRRQREERKLQRQKEIEAKRAARAGPMKLGAKKL